MLIFSPVITALADRDWRGCRVIRFPSEGTDQPLKGSSHA